jgi:hypothetical protein
MRRTAAATIFALLGLADVRAAVANDGRGADNAKPNNKKS